MIIGISGKIASGKDTVGKIIQYLDLQKNYPKTWTQWDFDFFINGDHTWKSDYQIKKFGYKLKQIASLVLDIPIERFEDQEFKKTELGEEWGYYYDEFGKINNEPFISKEGEAFYKQLTIREFLQRLGTEACRDSIHPDFWVNALFADYKPLDYKSIPNKDSLYSDSYTDIIYPNWIITDVRFPNEVKAIKDRGGKIIRIERMFNINNHIPIIPSNHYSETALDNYDGFDVIIENKGTIEQLIKQVKDLNIYG